MVIVQINATYGSGSTGHIVADIHKAAKEQGHESFVFCSIAQKKAFGSNVIKIGNTLDHKLHALIRRIKYNQGFNSVLVTKKLCSRLAKIKPDIVHLHNLHSNYINLPILLDFLANNDIVTVLTLHDCWFFTGQCTHFLKYKNCQAFRNSECADCPAIRDKNKSKYLFKIKKEKFSAIKRLGVIGVSDWITKLGQQSFLGDTARFKRIYNWVDCALFSPKGTADAVKNKYGIPQNKKIILGVSQGWSENKGLREFINLSESLKESATVVLVGEKGDNQSTESLKFIGYTSSAEALAELYSAADVFVNPSRMETFGKVTAEALSCSTPVVAYNNTGTAELVNTETGMLVPDGNVRELITCVKAVLDNGKEKYTENCRSYAIANFSKELLISEHLEFYKELSKSEE